MIHFHQPSYQTLKMSSSQLLTEEMTILQVQNV